MNNLDSCAGRWWPAPRSTPSDTPVYDAVVADLGYPAMDAVVPGRLDVTWEQHLGYLPAQDFPDY
ncbi:hypothetical protein ABT071_22005 [Streptomyces sp. NPDC002506]|uniref:hypothetical protein n=1 Tax=Streptomyces sp. NPDC002506 TaxID=3154536 RepID=UPI00331AB2D2